VRLYSPHQVYMKEGPMIDIAPAGSVFVFRNLFLIEDFQRADTFSRRLRPISSGGAFLPKTASATISPITGPCLKP
jgi:hypothetical protein